MLVVSPRHGRARQPPFFLFVDDDRWVGLLSASQLPTFPQFAPVDEGKEGPKVEPTATRGAEPSQPGRWDVALGGVKLDCTS